MSTGRSHFSYLYFSLTWFSTDDLWPHLSAVAGTVTSLSHHQSCVWIDYIVVIITWLVWFPHQQCWLFLPIWTKNINLPHPLHAIQVKNSHKIVSIKEELDVISWLEKGEGIVDVCHKVRLAHSSVHTVCDNANRIKESAMPATKVFV